MPGLKRGNRGLNAGADALSWSVINAPELRSCVRVFNGVCPEPERAARQFFVPVPVRPAEVVGD